MELTIIIVNYQVPYFLEQCIYSVIAATKFIDAEIIVVDNASNDESYAYLQPKFQQVKWILLPENLGFGKANNCGISEAKGKYCCFLNPDTLIPETLFHTAINCFKKQPLLGGLGVRMIDGSGCFLPESKRAFPGLRASFFKLSGLASIFPTSGYFNEYALGNLPNNQHHLVAVLAGACMFMPTHLAQLLNGFDEAFFMYGEDIDLSYRIEKAGFKNEYLGAETIIHFKGESSKKGLLNYTKIFYEAMFIFLEKHGKEKNMLIAAPFIKLAIIVKAFLSFIAEFVLSLKAKFLKIFWPSFLKKQAAEYYKNILIVGSGKKCLSAEQISYHWPYKQPKMNYCIIDSKNDTSNSDIIFDKLIAAEQTNIIFCIDEVFTYKLAINLTEKLGNKGVRCWYYGEQSGCIINSSSKQKTGDVILLQKMS
ncbi:MAG: glycosyltransferase family 2 protein [Chitinophagaceae bacterium]